jgi:hypothetical protein
MDTTSTSSTINETSNLFHSIPIAKIPTDYKLEKFANYIADKLYETRHVNIIKKYGGRIKILSAIIKKLNKKTLIVCKNYSTSDQYSETFANSELCAITQLIKLKVNKIDLSKYELIIFIDIPNKSIDSKYIDGKNYIVLNTRFDEHGKIINADNFFIENFILK